MGICDVDVESASSHPLIIDLVLRCVPVVNNDDGSSVVEFFALLLSRVCAFFVLETFFFDFDYISDLDFSVAVYNVSSSFCCCNFCFSYPILSITKLIRRTSPNA